MPYPWFTKMSRADVDAIKDYLATVPAASQRNKDPELPWPLSWRAVMIGWNLLFFHEGEREPVAAKSAQWNRGAYLVEGPGHCGACHTPKNVVGAAKRSDALQGGSIGEHWFAPSLTGDARDGIGEWSTAEIVEYLKTGSNDKTASAGEMTNVVKNSTQYLSDADLQAIAVYLKDVPARNGEASPAAANDQTMARGEALNVDNCTGCHMGDGAGLAKVFPPLKGSASIQASDPGSLIQVVLGGAQMAAPKTKPTGLAMPGFRVKLSDQDIADVVTYIRSAWGNRASPVDAATVAEVRKAELESPQGDPGATRASMQICASRAAPAHCPAPASRQH
jgi:mono/diheme cytochrome c family protein